LQQSLKFLWRMVLDEGSAWCTTLDSETMAGMLGVCIKVCGSDERDNELLNRVEQLLSKVSIDRVGFETPVRMLGKNVCGFGMVP
jgi:hypothetical protein